jgi:acyl carrier protein
VVPGELHLGGIGLARGYFQRPALTAEKFIPHPFSQIPGERLYKTGDLARYRSDGLIELLGRIDYQVKIRGIRIELGEITAALRQHPAVEDAVVQTWTDQVGDKQLVAYIISRERRLLSASELHAFLKQLLPEYMLPTSFVQLEAFPLSPNGKVDRQALPPPETQRSVSRAAFIAPRTPVEQILADIWAEMFNLEQIGIHDNFFELGGHSLLALRILAYVQEIFQMELPLSIIFKAPTVAELAEQLETMGRSAHQDMNEFARTFLSFEQFPEDEMNTPLPERADDPFETGR